MYQQNYYDDRQKYIKFHQEFFENKRSEPRVLGNRQQVATSITRY